ncbi:MAG TPA: winged-helix domain-containing protein, partial [Streptosporangiaceae bacterium]|nr:winged-helix domain-containing protein [Streptosporangiaceae bacterium]
FSSRELVARMRAVLRRRGDVEEVADATLEAGPVRMDVERHVVSVRGEQVQLPLKEFELLQVLLRNADRVLTRMQLIDRVWGADYVGDTKTLDVHIKRLRAKIEIDPAKPRHIVTVRGGTVQLPLKEFELLQVLLRNADRVLTRMQLIDRVWGADYVGDTKTLDVHIKRLRAKIEVDPAHPQHIVTVRGLGYKFESVV